VDARTAVARREGFGMPSTFPRARAERNSAR
jgi:hypothetical protein